MTNEEKIQQVIELIIEYRGYEGDHHKNWMLDQILQTLMGSEKYNSFREKLNNCEIEYDEGIAP